MRSIVLASLVALALVPVPTPAQVDLRIQLGVPLPPAPPVVVIQPGIQVVTGYPEEVFIVGGYYWLRRDDAWYRSVQPRTGFIFVAPSKVPPGLKRLPPGHYRNYTKDQAKAEKQAHKAEEKAQKHSGKGH
jgi:hypothetical protein